MGRHQTYLSIFIKHILLFICLFFVCRCLYSINCLSLRRIRLMKFLCPDYQPTNWYVALKLWLPKIEIYIINGSSYRFSTMLNGYKNISKYFLELTWKVDYRIPFPMGSHIRTKSIVGMTYCNNPMVEGPYLCFHCQLK